MQFDPNNKIVQLCAKGMELEAKQNPREANLLFIQAWDEATSDFEKFTAAHYVARCQQSVKDKLKWDEIALAYALKINTEGIAATYSSLYLNIGKCYEDLQEYGLAADNYQQALSHAHHLLNDGYGKMIKAGIDQGIIRISSMSHKL